MLRGGKNARGRQQPDDRLVCSYLLRRSYRSYRGRGSRHTKPAMATRVEYDPRTTECDLTRTTVSMPVRSRGMSSGNMCRVRLVAQCHSVNVVFTMMCMIWIVRV